jgi:hypothetical protein
MSSTNKTVPKQLTPFKPGQSGNPKGRPKGSRHKINDVFLRDFYEAWQAFGRPALLAAAWSKPAEFVKVAASLLPKEVEATITLVNAAELGDDELANIASGRSDRTAETQDDQTKFH